MRLSISNIAWDIDEDAAILRKLQEYSVDAIDIAPGKYFPDPKAASAEQIAEVRRWWNSNGVDIVGMQALLFGTKGLNIFGDLSSQTALLEHLQSVCRIGSHLGATKLVFGSPRNRDRSNFSDDEAHDIACHFFIKAAAIAKTEGVIICLEPNPVCYGANFMLNVAETARVVSAINHPSIKMQLDTGAITINQEDPFEILRKYSLLIGHVHLSEPNLLPLGEGGTDHSRCDTAIKKFLSDTVVTIEMLATQTEPHINSIDRAIKAARHYYF